MATDEPMIGFGRGSQWTWFVWGAAAALLSMPYFAMRFSTGVDWSADDFAVMGIMLAILCGLVEIVTRLTGNIAYRLAVCAAVGAAFLITWANLAVGIVGSEDNPSNRLFFYALLVGLIGASLARFRPRGMALAMLATAAATAAAFLVAVSGTTDERNVSHWLELVATSVVASPFLLSAWLFRKAARA